DPAQLIGRERGTAEAAARGSSGRCAHAFARACSAARTSSGCFSALATRAQCFCTFPSGPIHTVERITPFVFLPYIIFSPNAPYAAITFRSGSDSRVNGSLYLAANFL